MDTHNQQLTDTDNLRPTFAPRPRTIEETGLSPAFIADLICKYLHVYGIADLYQLSENIALSGNILESVLDGLRK